MKEIVRRVLGSANKVSVNGSQKHSRPGNHDQHSARKTFDSIADEIKGLIKQIDLLYKLTARGVELFSPFTSSSEDGNGDGDRLSAFRTARRLLKQLDEERKDAVEQLKQAVYFHRQMVWLTRSFPQSRAAGRCLDS